MHKNLKIIITVLILVIGLGVWRVATSSDDVATGDSTSAVETAGLQISDDGRTVGYSGQVGETALQTLQDLGIDVRTETSEFGVYVTGIGDVDADSSSNFWAFYVNGNQSEVGADSYVAEKGDQIEWRLEDIIF